MTRHVTSALETLARRATRIRNTKTPLSLSMTTARSRRSRPITSQRTRVPRSLLAMRKNRILILAIGAESFFLRAEPVVGKCYVLTFSAAHNQTLADLSATEIVPVIDAWTEIYTSHLSPKNPLAAVAPATHLPPDAPTASLTKPKSQYRYMQIFENKGAAMGCSNPHPHGQVWTTSSLPEEPAIELEHLQKYRAEHSGSHLLGDYVALECQKQERIVFENDGFVVVCPWWATWPFETMIISKTHKRALVDLNADEKAQLAEAIAEITRRYDNLFETHFPYSMGIHQAPLEGTEEEIEASWLHLHFYPPLLRSATVRKFLVGYVSFPFMQGLVVTMLMRIDTK